MKRNGCSAVRRVDKPSNSDGSVSEGSLWFPEKSFTQPSPENSIAPDRASGFSEPGGDKENRVAEISRVFSERHTPRSRRLASFLLRRLHQVLPDARCTHVWYHLSAPS